MQSNMSRFVWRCGESRVDIGTTLSDEKGTCVMRMVTQIVGRYLYADPGITE